MFFNLFKKKESKPEFTDITFMNTKGKTDAVLKLANEDQHVIFIAWFSSTAQIFQEQFLAHSLDEKRVIEARHLHRDNVQKSNLIFLEHHPLRSKEENFLQSFSLNKTTVYNALDESFFKHFGGEKITEMMQKMGMKEDEAISHSMISTSIARAQKKIEDKISTEISARSMDEWMKLNAG